MHINATHTQEIAFSVAHMGSERLCHWLETPACTHLFVCAHRSLEAEPALGELAWAQLDLLVLDLAIERTAIRLM